ncbi:hypothetical protein VULLAG_LOCUS2543 [Vulpes lagopus]
MHHGEPRLTEARKTNPEARRCCASLGGVGVHVTSSAGPGGHVTARAPSRGESRPGCARAFAAASLPLDGRVRSGGVIGRPGRCACAANSCHPVRNKSSKFPKSPRAGGCRLPPRLPPLGRVPVPTRAPGTIT